ncbi:hypothetical protein UVI_02043920 [Ustilaginoidea virens]|uniref:BRCT domain-containing protein n=1 Tax=Ustilaginoidea virens TaxID=1159556 RepID=A0A1B5L4A4_USTVR|nr:hypothetical protein UVI_02043920 [Ustilaginoidea virens]
MTRLDSIVLVTDKAAWEGTKESQDTQAILDAHKAELGVGTHLQIDNLEAPDDIPDTAPLDEHEAYIVRPDDATAELGYSSRSPLRADETSSAVPGRKKMDVSQQTPTQINDERDYAAFCEPLGSSTVDDDTQNTTHDEPHTLNPDDTGAVNFGISSELPRPSSQVSEDGGFENTRGEWRRPDDIPRAALNSAFTPHKPQDLLPETPALPKNPFGNKSDGAVPFGGTQLFGQTQLLSSAAKMASPTSSRPSPNVFLNSISPRVMGTSPLKNRANVSSPTDIRTSSPARLHEIPATLLKDKDLGTVAQETPMPARSQKDELIPESPTYQSPLSLAGRKPMAHYEPMKQSQERKMVNRKALLQRLASESDSDDDTLQQLERKKRVERKRALAAKEMNKVRLTRTPRRPSDEEPNKKRRKVDEASEKRRNSGLQAVDVQAAPTLLGDSQKAASQSTQLPSLRSTKATPGTLEEVESDKMRATSANAQNAAEPEPDPIDDEMIPATSPICSSPNMPQRDVPSNSEPELPLLRRDGTEQPGDGVDCSSLPLVRRRSLRTYGKRGREQRSRLCVISSPETAATENAVGCKADEQVSAEPRIDADHRAQGSQDAVKQADMLPRDSRSELPAPMGARSRRGEAKIQTPRPYRASRPAPATTSSMTNFSSTPAASSKTTPGTQLGTQDSHASERSESVSLLSPAKGAKPPGRRGGNTAESESPKPVTKAMRLSRRLLRMHSDSTDDRHRSSPCATAPNRSTTQSKSVRGFRASSGPVSRARRLFDCMIFALSFSENRGQRTKLEAKITQAGGAILHEGFHEMFEPLAIIHSANTTLESDESPLKLAKMYADCGFAAVIADGHSRKTKYMQALALGLPCLAPQWATTCLERGEIVDWVPYLLCAGASQVLGNAIRSRTLAPYCATAAKLPDVLRIRGRLLEGERLLIVVDCRKLRKETKQQYLFLAAALGPCSVSRVSTVQQAGESMRQAEQGSAPFGWIYMDPSIGTVEDVLAAAAAAAAAQQTTGRRKRKLAAAEPAGQNVSVLTDELMIQSLILGRMVEAGEMG